MQKKNNNNKNYKKVKRKQTNKKLNNKTIINKYVMLYTIGLTFVCLILLVTSFINKKECIKCEECKEDEFILTEHSPNYIFLGDSLTANYNVFEAFPEIRLVNSGYGGDRTSDILKNMYERVYRYNPSDVILHIGTNDVNDQDTTVDEIYANIVKIIEKIKYECPNANIYVQSIYPSRESWGITDNNSDRKQINRLVEEYSEEHNITYIDMYSVLKEESSDKIKEEYVTDGLHLNEKGYEVVTQTLRKYLNLQVE